MRTAGRAQNPIGQRTDVGILREHCYRIVSGNGGHENIASSMHSFRLYKFGELAAGIEIQVSKDRVALISNNVHSAHNVVDGLLFLFDRHWRRSFSVCAKHAENVFFRRAVYSGVQESSSDWLSPAQLPMVSIHCYMRMEAQVLAQYCTLSNPASLGCLIV